MSRSPWDEFFGDFDEEFERMRRMMNELMADAMRASREHEGSREPFVYGFTLRTGPDGRPHFEQFGTTQDVQVGSEGGGREPLTDVLENDEEVSITMELPGVEKEDINLKVASDTVSLRVDTPDRHYRKSVDLPCEVLPESAEATYKNGILDLVIQRAGPREDEGTAVEIK